MSARSYLYAPADRPGLLEKALARGGDAIIADFEDAVAPANKDVARANFENWISGKTDQALVREVWVRVNAGSALGQDIAAVARPGVRGIVLPKADADSVAEADALLTVAEEHAHLPAGSIALAPLVESAAGVLGVARLARAPRVSHLGIGEADLCADLGITADAAGTELLPLRLQMVVASSAAGLHRPTGPVHLQVRDLSELRGTTEALRRLGFGARAAIHPDQVAVIEEVFTPSPEEVERARELIAGHDGRGGGVADDGRFVDQAVLRAAREVVAQAHRLGL